MFLVRLRVCLILFEGLMINNLALKLVVTPLIIGLASSASRRWGQAVGGWLVGLPLTSGPVVLFLATDHGPQFARSAALGSLAGGLAQPAFCLGYGWCATRFSWAPALLAGALGFVAVATLLHGADLRIIPLFFSVVLAVGATLRIMPRSAAETESTAVPGWDIPIRMVTATVIVVALTSAATVLGPTLSGILATFPIYAATLATFEHRLAGWQAAVQMLRGLLFGLFGSVVFFLLLAVLLTRTPIASAFLAATATALAVQGGALWAMRRTVSQQPKEF
jgi:hypothetical protein